MEIEVKLASHNCFGLRRLFTKSLISLFTSIIESQPKEKIPRNIQYFVNIVLNAVNLRKINRFLLAFIL